MYERDSGKKGPSESVQFQGLPEAIFSYLFTFLFKELPHRIECFNLEETVVQPLDTRLGQVKSLRHAKLS